MNTRKFSRRYWIAWSAVAAGGLALFAGAWKLSPRPTPQRIPHKPLYVVIADTSAKELFCSCAPPSMQKQYEPLRAAMQEKLQRPVRFDYIADFRFDDLPAEQAEVLRSAHMVIGKHSAIAHVVRANGLPLHHVATLTREDGGVGLRGVFVTRADSDVRSLRDLNGRRISLGRPFHAEKHAAARDALRNQHATPSQTETRLLCKEAVQDVLAGQSDAAVLSDYSVHLLDNPELAPTGSLRIIGETAAVPFVAAFVRDGLSSGDAAEIVRFLVEGIGSDSGLRAALRTQRGFVPAAAENARP